MYVVLEIQKDNDTVATLVNSYATRNEAENKYHSILSAAAISEVDVHSALMCTDEGIPIKNEHYSHLE